MKKNLDMFKKLIFATLVIGTVTFQNCKPKEVDLIPAPITAPEVTLPSAIKNVDGVLAAIITVTKDNAVELTIGSAYAVFYKSKNPATKLDAGTVKINTKTALKSDDNIYFYTASATEPNGLIYQSQVFWQVNGSVANDVPSINSNDGTGLPSIPSVPEFMTMNVDQDKLILWTSSSGADSVVLILKGPSATYKRVFGSTVTTHTVPKAEIVKLGIGSGNLQIINYKLDFRTIGTKNYAFLKQAVGICSKVGITL